MFGKYGIRLTKNARNLLESNLPEYFEIEYDGSFNNYYIAWEDFDNWVKAAGVNKE